MRAAASAGMKGSYPSTFIRRPRARSATMRPTLPRPMTPRVLLHTSTPVNFCRFHLPLLTEATAWGMCRARASISEMVCSPVVTLLPPGVFITTMPFLLAASTSIFSTPTPARPMILSRSAASMTSAVTLVPLRRISPS